MGNGRTKVGVIGCGMISGIYLENMTQNLNNLEVVFLADLFVEKAKEAAARYGVVSYGTVEELLSRDDIDLVLNTTIPAVHYEVSKQVLTAGKSVYSEKPCAMSAEEAAELVRLAEEKGLYFGSAPDTFLGPGIQKCRQILDADAIGKLVGFTANMVCPGHELWHTNPDFYYQKGGGPMMDMGPYYLSALVFLLGPIEEVTCFAATSAPKRKIRDRTVEVEVPTHYEGLIRFCSGVIGNIKMSFDVWNSQLPSIEIYGTAGSLYVPDPNTFEGPIKLFRSEGLVELVESRTDPMERLMTLYDSRDQFLEEISADAPNMRGIGIADMASAMTKGRTARANGELARHVMEALTGFDISWQEKKPYHMTTTVEQPAPLAEAPSIWMIAD